MPYDIYFPSYDQISKMVTAKLIRPINHSYFPNIANVWETYQNPWYDQGWHYTVPYTVYTTGIGWRTDQVPDDIAGMTNPYDVFWDAKYKGKIAVIDDWHTAMALAQLRIGGDVNATDTAADRQDQEADGGHAGGLQAQGHDHDVQRPAGRPARHLPDVVRRRDQRAVLPGQGHQGRRCCATGRRRPTAWSTTT